MGEEALRRSTWMARGFAFITNGYDVCRIFGLAGPEPWLIRARKRRPGQRVGAAFCHVSDQNGLSGK